MSGQDKSGQSLLLLTELTVPLLPSLSSHIQQLRPFSLKKWLVFSQLHLHSMAVTHDR
jgi:hypothetical protein